MGAIPESLRQKLSASMKDQALKAGEYRGIQGEGAHFFSLSPKNGYADNIASADVDGVTVYIFKV